MKERRCGRSRLIFRYWPQLTSVLSIANRITGALLSLGGIRLVALAPGGHSRPAFAAVQNAVASWIGKIVLSCFTFSFFLHFLGGLRHLVWDTAHGSESV